MGNFSCRIDVFNKKKMTPKNKYMDTIKPDFSEANKFAVLTRGFKEEFDKGYNEFWTKRNMEIPNGDWRVVAARNKERDGIK